MSGRVEGEGKGFFSSWETARVVVGRLIGINKGACEVTVEVEGEDGELFVEDYDLREGFGEEEFEELVGYLDMNVRVVLLDNTVVRVTRSERRELWEEEKED